MDRRKAGDVLFWALECAKSDRIAFCDAYSNDKKEPAVKDALADIKAFERLQMRLFGTNDTELGAAIKKLQDICWR